jgi:hypothetical protein
MLDTLLDQACESGNVELVKNILKSEQVFGNNDGHCIVIASELGYIQILKILLNDQNTICYKNINRISYINVLEFALEEAHTNVVMYLEQKIDELTQPEEQNNSYITT